MLRSENGPLQRECCTVALQKGDTCEKGDSDERNVGPDRGESAGKEKLRL